ncbi:MAG TPA: hypothetical protein VKB77_06910 [Terriglobales bacterium]|nr:hypothetical protein [Terriglobales bacterium]
MRKNSWLGGVVVGLLAVSSWAQVLSPAEIKDPELRALQLQYMDELKAVGQEIVSHSFDYPFYLSRKLDLDEVQQRRADQRSIRFDRYNGQIVLAVTGNYFAAYSATQVNKTIRARDTFLHVITPILQASVPRFQNNKQIRGYAVEVSHHILSKVMGVSLESPENEMVYLPQGAAVRLVGAKDDTVKQAALLQGQVFLDAEPVTVFLSDKPLASAEAAPPSDGGSAGDPPTQASAEVASSAAATSLAPTLPATPDKPKETAPPPHDTSAQAIAALQGSQQDVLTKLVKELDSQAHFVSYAPPAFIAFRQGIYLQLSLNTTLPETAGGSRYRIAAMAFDEHIAHLIRPVAGDFEGEQNFDGINFSTTIHVTGKTPAVSASQSVEFFFPLSSIRCYEKYDCTGQQLIDQGVVLINGERVGLELQTAESH